MSELVQSEKFSEPGQNPEGNEKAEAFIRQIIADRRTDPTTRAELSLALARAKAQLAEQDENRPKKSLLRFLLADYYHHLNEDTVSAQRAGMIMSVVRQALRVENANKATEAAKKTDSKTGLLNAETFKNVLAKLLETRRAGDKPFGVVMIDLDKFKNFNDKYGHIAGDKVLIRFAQILSRAIRSDQDVASRYGGEEFALIIKGDAETIEKIMQRIRDDVAKEVPEFPTSTMGWILSNQLKRTATADEAIELADKVLYEGKKTTRNVSIRSSAPILSDDELRE